MIPELKAQALLSNWIYNAISVEKTLDEVQASNIIFARATEGSQMLSILVATLEKSFTGWAKMYTTSVVCTFFVFKLIQIGVGYIIPIGGE